MSQPSPSLPQKPELVTLSPVEHLLHNAALRRGQSEGASESAVALMRASAHYKAQEMPDEVKVVVSQILEQLSAQLTAQATQAKQEQNVLLGQWIMARKAASEVSGGVTPRRIGWAVRAWRATVRPLWAWVFAN